MDDSLKIYYQNSNPRIEFYRVDIDKKKKIKLLTISNFDSLSAKLVSFSFDQNLESLYGKFNVQIKENYKSKGMVLDLIKPLDLIYIYEKGETVSFIGVVSTISFGATAGNYNKSVNIAGSSAGILLEMMNFSTDKTSMAFFISDSANLKIVDSLAVAIQKNVENGGLGITFKEAFEIIYKKFIEVMTDDKYSHIGTSGIYEVVKKIFGEPDDFLDSSISFNYQIERNLFSNGSVNLYDYFKGLLPDEVYEFYGKIVNGKPKIIVREKPFDIKDWNKLKKTTLNPALITDYTVSRSNENVFTCFFSIIEGSSLDRNFYKITQATENGNPCFGQNLDKSKIYGYKPLEVNFIGYARKALNKDGEKNHLENVFLKLNNRLKSWYSRLDEMFSGEVSVVLSQDVEMPQMGELVELCGSTFYVTGESHLWVIGQSPVVKYTLERGGNYSNSGFEGIANISNQFSELLKKD